MKVKSKKKYTKEFKEQVVALVELGNPRNFIPRTSDGKTSRPSPNLLAGQSGPNAINKVWTGDITHIPTSKGWRYLAVVIDLHSRRIIGWSLADQMRADLVCQALEQTLGTRDGHMKQVTATAVQANKLRCNIRFPPLSRHAWTRKSRKSPSRVILKPIMYLPLQAPKRFG